MTHRAPKSRQAGMTMVELMVAMVISLLLLAGVIQIFVGNRQTYRVQDGAARIQESGRFAIDLMAREMRMAGFQGCTKLESVAVEILAKPPVPMTAFSAAASVIGHEYAGSSTWSPVLPAELTGAGVAPIDGTDVLTIRGAQPANTTVVGNYEPNNANVQLSNNDPAFAAGDLVFLTDCVSGHIFRATNVSSSGSITIAHSASGNNTPKLNRVYGPETMIYKFRSAHYYVGDTGRVNQAGEAITALYRLRTEVNPAVLEELLEGVAALRIQYGIDTNNDNAPDRLVDASGIGTNRVVAVRLDLLARSAETNLALAPRAYGLNGLNYNDRHLSRTFGTTVQLRNLGM